MKTLSHPRFFAFICAALLLMQPSQSYANPLKWKVNKEESSIKFVANYGGVPITGSFTQFDADIVFDVDKLEASAVKATIDTGTVTSDNADAAGSLPGKDWFASKDFPKAVFECKKFRKLDGRKYEGEGSLTLKGKTVPVRIVFNLDIKDTDAIMRGKATLSRTAFSVGEGEWKNTEVVADNVTVEVKIAATRE